MKFSSETTKPFVDDFLLSPEARKAFLDNNGNKRIEEAFDHWYSGKEAKTAMDYAQILGPAQARQVVLRAACGGEATLRWRLERQQA